jgi:hypothetical protein
MDFYGETGRQDPTPNQQYQHALPDEVKNLGRKARARLEQERSKRREIMRVDILPPETQRVAPNRSALVDAVNQDASKKSAKSAPKKRRILSNKEDSVEDRNVDRWMPDISHIPVPTSKEKRSNVVQVHGLPVGTTPAQIRRFFSGLDPRRILILPTNTANLRELDARHDVPRKGGLKVDRYAQLRILVKFHSAPTAALAAQRSGEVMHVSELKGASIAVTQMLKNTASYFVKKLAVDVEPGIALESTMDKIESSLDAVVPTILWAAAIKDLKLNVASYAGAGTFHLYRRGLSPRKPASNSETTVLQQHRATLQQEVDRLMNTPPFPAAEPLDPALLQSDPVMNLTSNCLGILQTEIERIDNALSVASRWNFLVSTRPPPQDDAADVSANI